MEDLTIGDVLAMRGESYDAGYEAGVSAGVNVGVDAERVRILDLVASALGLDEDDDWSESGMLEAIRDDQESLRNGGLYLGQQALRADRLEAQLKDERARLRPLLEECLDVVGQYAPGFDLLIDELRQELGGQEAS